MKVLFNFSNRRLHLFTWNGCNTEQYVPVVLFTVMNIRPRKWGGGLWISREGGGANGDIN